jgi:hypothetical protein
LSLTFNTFIIGDTEESDDDIYDTSKNINNSNVNSERWIKIIEDWIVMVNMEKNRIAIII